MGSRIPCFFIEPTGKTRLFLRRYESGSTCPSGYYHEARVPVEDLVDVRGDGIFDWDDANARYPRSDSRWPRACRCGYSFDPADEWQFFNPQLFRRLDTGELLIRQDAPAGALWFEDHYLDTQIYWPGPDGHILFCRTPGGLWVIDSRASNCKLPNDNEHRCWVREGDPRDPTGARGGRPLTVGKNGLTCSAGAGSIQCNDYHGFLRKGFLEEC